jgi:protein SCO1
MDTARARIARLPRRRLLVCAASLPLMGVCLRARAEAPPTGWVQPAVPAPPLRVIQAPGKAVALGELLAGHVTAVQLMFTGCSTSCPVQGALFAALAARPGRQPVQLLSISIDVLGDTPDTVAAWQRRLGPHATWRGAVAHPNDVDRLATYLKGAASRSGTHTAQVFVFDRQGRLSYRTGDNPGLRELEALIDGVGRSSPASPA